MKRLVLMCALLTITAAAPTQAQINLAWNDCLGQPDAVAIIDYACDGSWQYHPRYLALSFIAPANLPEFLGLRAEILIDSGGSNLPDFWRLGAAECRDGMISFPASLSGIGSGASGACQNPWWGTETDGDYTYSSDDPASGRAKLGVSFARREPRALEAGQHYVAGAISLGMGQDIDSGSGVCGGCSAPVRITVLQIELYQSNGDVTILAGPATRNYVDWQNDITPVARRTWGAIKSQYR